MNTMLTVIGFTAGLVSVLVLLGRRRRRPADDAWAEQMDRELDGMHCHCGQAPSVYLHGKRGEMRYVTRFGKN